MNSRMLQAFLRNARLVCAGAACTLLFNVGSLHAANAVAISLNVAKGQTATKRDSSTDSKTGTKTDTSTNEMFYTLSLLNPGNAPLTGLSVEYHIYNRNSDTVDGKITTAVDDISGTETLDLAPHAKKDIETTHAPHKDSTITPGPKKGVQKTGAQETHRQTVLGIIIVIKQGNQQIKKYEDPDGLRDQVDKLMGKNSAF